LQFYTDICIIFNMKTTLNIHDALLQEAKAFAARQQVTLTRLIEDGLRLRLRAQDVAVVKPSRPMPVWEGEGGMRPGLTGLSTRELLDAADDDS
jgi:tRNA threonylcarbamoyladenosine modification (KEOPS) complex  Pcc1 subunit